MGLFDKKSSKHEPDVKPPKAKRRKVEFSHKDSGKEKERALSILKKIAH